MQNHNSEVKSETVLVNSETTGQADMQKVLEEIFGGEEEKEVSGFKPSKYQQAIFDFVRSGNGHGIVYGVAGCGKTTTIIKALGYLPDSVKVVLLAFNKRIADELKAKGMSNASTFHSLGRRNIAAAMPRSKFNQYKIYDILDKIEIGLSYEEKSIVSKIVSLLKGNLSNNPRGDAETILDEMDNIDYDDQEWYINLAVRTFEASVKKITEYDFDDMIYFPAAGLVPCEKFDFIAVDECQDLNMAQIKFAQNSLKDDGRMLLIGDPWQSIYAFRGAFVGIMEYMQDKLQAARLPLSISYRAPKVIGELVNSKYPEIEFSVSETAIEGEFIKITISKFTEQIEPGDSVICRFNAPLVPPCFSLIRRGVKATILGRDIGKGLIALVNKRAKLKRTNSLPDLIDELYVYLRNEKEKLEKAKKFQRMTALEDQVETIVAIADNCETIDELREKIKSTFSDEVKGIVFSSIHKSKGLEWDTVYVLQVQNKFDGGQEKNIEYVGDTRASKRLIYVYGD